MLYLLKLLPEDLVGKCVMGFLAAKDLVMLERATSSQTSREFFLQVLPHCLPIDLNNFKYSLEIILWLNKRR